MKLIFTILLFTFSLLVFSNENELQEKFQSIFNPENEFKSVGKIGNKFLLQNQKWLLN